MWPRLIASGALSRFMHKCNSSQNTSHSLFTAKSLVDYLCMAKSTSPYPIQPYRKLRSTIGTRTPAQADRIQSTICNPAGHGVRRSLFKVLAHPECAPCMSATRGRWRPCTPRTNIRVDMQLPRFQTECLAPLRIEWQKWGTEAQGMGRSIPWGMIKHPRKISAPRCRVRLAITGAAQEDPLHNWQGNRGNISQPGDLLNNRHIPSKLFNPIPMIRHGTRPCHPACSTRGIHVLGQG